MVKSVKKASASEYPATGAGTAKCMDKKKLTLKKDVVNAPTMPSQRKQRMSTGGATVKMKPISNAEAAANLKAGKWREKALVNGVPVRIIDLNKAISTFGANIGKDHDDAVAQAKAASEKAQAATDKAKASGAHEDHTAAGRAHGEAADAHYRAHGNSMDQQMHQKRMMRHHDMARDIKAAGGSGEGSRGGQVVGHTATGKAKYKASSGVRRQRAGGAPLRAKKNGSGLKKSEGARGGVILGHTSSGKPVYRTQADFPKFHEPSKAHDYSWQSASQHVGYHPGTFDVNDHREAAQHHIHQMTEALKHPDFQHEHRNPHFDAYRYHSEVVHDHMNAAHTLAHNEKLRKLDRSLKPTVKNQFGKSLNNNATENTMSNKNFDFDNLFKSELGGDTVEKALIDCPHCDQPITKSQVLKKAKMGASKGGRNMKGFAKEQMNGGKNNISGEANGGHNEKTERPNKGVPARTVTKNTTHVEKGEDNEDLDETQTEESDIEASDGGDQSTETIVKSEGPTVRGSRYVQFVDSGEDARIAKMIEDGSLGIGGVITQPIDKNTKHRLR